jgi:hypothetical protein
MAIHRVTLRELREIVLDIIKEEKELNDNLEVKKNKVINKLKSKSMGLSYDEAKLLVDSNEDIVASDKDVNKIAVELKIKHKGS